MFRYRFKDTINVKRNNFVTEFSINFVNFFKEIVSVVSE